MGVEREETLVKQAGASEQLVFGALRVVRLLLAAWVVWSIVGAVGGLIAAFQWYRGANYFLISLITWGRLVLALACFEFSRRLINRMHRQSFGRSHPKMRTFWGL